LICQFFTHHVVHLNTKATAALSTRRAESVVSKTRRGWSGRNWSGSRGLNNLDRAHSWWLRWNRGRSRSRSASALASITFIARVAYAKVIAWNIDIASIHITIIGFWRLTLIYVFTSRAFTNLSKPINTETGICAILDFRLPTVLIPFGITGVSARISHPLFRRFFPLFRLFTADLAIADKASTAFASVTTNGVGTGSIFVAWRVKALILVDARQRTPLERNRLQNAVAISRQDRFKTWEAATFVSVRRIKIDTVRSVDIINLSGAWIVTSTLVLRIRKAVSNTSRR
jgi:hypothetical protein